jgi:hypothetical protein
MNKQTEFRSSVGAVSFFCSRFFPVCLVGVVLVVISLSSSFSVQQQLLVLFLCILSVLFCLPALSYISIPYIPVYMLSIPSPDKFFGKQNEISVTDNFNGVGMPQTGPGAVDAGWNSTQPINQYNPYNDPRYSGVMNTAIVPVSINPPRTLFQPPESQRLPRLSLAASLTDPAAVALNRRQLVLGAESSRDKAV